jgi:hypothetical protein
LKRPQRERIKAEAAGYAARQAEREAFRKARRVLYDAARNRVLTARYRRVA